MLIPHVGRSRELPFEITHLITENHVPWLGDFCLNCGADLRIVRLHVTEVPPEAKGLLAVAEAADYPDSAADRKLLASLNLSAADYHRLRQLLYEGCDTALYSHCGLDNLELAGIAADGTFLHVAAPSSETPVEAHSCFA